jgi:hypothetical protein
MLGQDNPARSCVEAAHTNNCFYQFQIKDDLKAARIEAARRTGEYVEMPKTSQRREGLDLELELILHE